MDSLIKKINTVKTKNNVVMKIDIRERELIDALNDNEFVRVEQLDLGDIQIIINDEIILVIERKSLKDLSSSIRDGRLREQKLRLMNIYDIEKIVYLIEGKITSKMIKNLETAKIGSMKITSLIGAQTNIIARDGLKVIRTSCVEETIYLLTNLYHKYQIYGKTNTNEQKKKYYIDTIKLVKKDNMTSKNCFIIQLAQIPGCSKKVAKIIVEEVKSMINLCKLYSQLETIEEKEKLLEGITYPIINNKSRKVSIKLSKKIFHFMNCDII